MVPRSISDRTKLNNGVTMPWLGLGVFQTRDGREVEEAVEAALAAGYRSIDTAAFYANETGVGTALRASGLPREELFLTTKVWNSDHGYEPTLRAFEASRRRLGLDYVDLYLIHWPVPGKFRDTWRALEQLQRDGRVRVIGVSNFKIHHLEDVLADSPVVPAVNQVEFHPLLTQPGLLRFCSSHGIQLEAWSPLMQGRLDHPLLTELARQYGRTAAQIVLRWDLQKGVVTIPKSIHAHRIKENAAIFDFELSTADVARIDGLNRDGRIGPDPDQIDF